MIKSVLLAAIIALPSSMVLAADAPSTTPITTSPPAEVTSVVAEAMDPHATATATVHAAAAAATQPANQNVTGTVKFAQDGNDVKFVADIDGLAPNTDHGFHIHAKADLSDPALAKAGPHFNPTNEKHGDPHAEHHHVGDLGNLHSDDTGHAHLEGTIPNATLVGGEHPISGRSVIIHAKADDLKSDPAGNSGARVAGGVIEVTK